nr:hypothetical protein GZ9C4_39 [uncultured archaeon GZfos9C4]
MEFEAFKRQTFRKVCSKMLRCRNCTYGYYLCSLPQALTVFYTVLMNRMMPIN